ncbi:MAG: hypothetical protein JJ953_00965 [Gracilimonas sp.]|nr:hypothetical protein [Gracilimonas sp.]MBO6584652.1 hypothetical protein [Gracilimonas sp.]MBO6616077.1 hypothetical protein [Gracilimonas sp.]
MNKSHNLGLPFSILLIIIALGSCAINSEKEDHFEPIFKAEINGESFDGTDFEESAKASMTQQGDYHYLTIAAYQYNKNLFPYNEYIGISLIYQQSKNSFPTKKDTIKVNEYYDRYPGGKYSESDGDAKISWYEAFDENGYITVEMKELENGEIVVYGTFEMKVAVQSRADQYSQRVNQDTLSITNGEYRLMLEDRR